MITSQKQIDELIEKHGDEPFRCQKCKFVFIIVACEFGNENDAGEEYINYCPSCGCQTLIAKSALLPIPE